MRWSIRLGTVAGIGIYMHLTFLLILAWVGWAHWVQEQSLAVTAVAIVFVLAIFACVVLHELGHALTARRFGIRTRDITLLPIGGLARLERIPEEPRQELWVAVAGPGVNVLIAIAIGAWLQISGALEPVERLSVTSGPFLERLMAVNLFLAAFNLIPAFPMDGGRILRALLATRMEHTRATQIAATIGQGLALVFGFAGLFASPILLFIALFVWIGASQEVGLVEMRSALSGIPVSRAMLTDFRGLSPQASLADAVALTLAGSQKDYPVLESGRVVGILVQSDLLTALSENGAAVPVSEVMQREFVTADPAEMLATVFQRLSECACHTAAVVQDQRLVGVVTMDNIGELVAIEGAMDKARSKAA